MNFVLPPLFGTVSPGDIVVEILSWLAFPQRWTASPNCWWSWR